MNLQRKDLTELLEHGESRDWHAQSALNFVMLLADELMAMKNLMARIVKYMERESHCCLEFSNSGGMTHSPSCDQPEQGLLEEAKRASQ